MNSSYSLRIPVAIGLVTVLTASTISRAAAQNPTRIVASDSVVVVPGEIYKAGHFHQVLLGKNYRDEWTTPIKVPVLNLRTFHGGLKPDKKGGGAQTISLRFDAADGSKWAFRSVKKRSSVLPAQYKGTIIWYIVADEGSASHPLGALAADPLQTAAGVLHPHPAVAVMPDDPILGEFRQEFGGLLGEIEEHPDVPKNGPAFAGASRIIGSDTLLDRINTDPQTRVDARTLLTARELDLLMGDNDRHPDQWKWARYGGHEAPWVPIATDRDHAFVSYEGFVMKVARMAVPSLVTFESKYPDPSSLSANAIEFDRRMLAGFDRTVWDSVAISLQQRITDQVIYNALATLPAQYANGSRVMAAKLRARRDGLRAEADRYYHELWTVADIHGTDADDQATVVRSGDGIVDVRIQSGNDAPYFSRRFYANETTQIRIYLHGGNDRATVEGNVRNSIKVRIIGGNGDNVFVDNSTVGGERNPTRFYDAGNVNNVVYARDTVDEKINIDDAFNHYFNRRPWQRAYGKLIPPQKDRGSSFKPVLGIHSQRGLGYYPVIGIAHTSYGFRDVPYATMTEADVGYSAKSSRWRVRGNFDKRLEQSDVHFPATAHMSQFEIVQFHGFGNNTTDPLRNPFFDVRERQWEFNPGIGRSFSPVSDISIGPIVRYTTTDSVPTRFIAQQRPYGFSRFGQLGAQLKLHLDSRYVADTMKPRFVLNVVGAGYPTLWSVGQPSKAYESADAWAAAYFTLPTPKLPVLAFRVGGKKLWGSFPYFDAAFLGGSENFRTEERQRYAGDASVYGSTELRVPVAKFPFILPLDVGLLGFTDVGRVYLNGQSPGGWHSVAGGGFWVGYLNPGTNLNVMFTNSKAHRVTTSLGFAF
jgi:hypothetical protein